MATLYWILKIGGVLLFGAVTNGVWEYILKPLLLKLTPVFLKIVTFGIRSIKDGIYLQAAQREIFPSLPVLYIAPFVALLAYVYCSGHFYMDNLVEPFKKAEIATRITSETSPTHKTGEELHKEAEHNLQLASRFAKYNKGAITFFSLFMSSLVFMSLIRIAFISGIINGFEHKLTIIRPFLTENEAFIIAASFAKMKTEKDYDEIVKKLNSAISQNQTESTPL